MANYWAITIGINQYRHLQPLMYAQDDALLIHRFFVEEAGVSEERCILLSDLTNSVANQVVYPDKPAIAQWIQTVAQQVEADDVIWFFFSGYGAQIEGKDYLMPIDGDPERIESTGMALSDLVDTLAKLPTENSVLLLDINRSQGALADQKIGSEAIALAEQRQVTTFLACQPEQYSHETIGVRHGLFTAALLEAMEQGRKTPTEISEYLNKRLPELCEHHWRPIQNAVSIIAQDKAQAVILPEVQSTLAANATGANLAADMEESSQSSQSLDKTEYARGYRSRSNATADLSASSSAVGLASVGTGAVGAMALSDGTGKESLSTDASSQTAPSNLGVIQPPYTEETISTGTYRTEERSVSRAGDGPTNFTRDDDSMSVTGAKLRNWGLLALALLMGGVLLRQPFVQTAWQGLRERISGGEQVGSSDVASSEDALSDESVGAAEGAALLEAETATETEGSVNADASESEEGEVEAQTNIEGQTDVEAEETSGSADEAIISEVPTDDTAIVTEPVDTDSENTEAASAVTAEDTAAAQALIAQANAAIEQQQYSEALIALQQVPRSQRDSTFSATLAKARNGSAEVKETNASVLTEARTSIQPTQASQFADAIAKARLIKPGEPFYEAAQRDIRSWSQVILDIAEGRATSGNLDSAIAAANLLPKDSAELHQKAQDRIALWQQRQNSRKIIADAQKIPKSGQASTYQQGIVKLREVPIEHPEYETAQRLADQWSQSIFSIAQARAAQGRQNAAIQAAILVPAGTTAYEPTQEAIRRWRAEG